MERWKTRDSEGHTIPTWDSPLPDDYDYREELKGIRLEKIDKELAIYRKIQKLRNKIKLLFKRYHATKNSENPNLEELSYIEKTISHINTRIHELHQRLDWYEKSKIASEAPETPETSETI